MSEKPGSDWPWRELLSTQARFLRELWQVGTSNVKDPSSWTTQTGQFWSRWSSPSAWFPGSQRTSEGAAATAYFVVDAAAEATGERFVALPFPLSGTSSLEATALRNVQGRGEIGPGHVEIRLVPEATGDQLGVALVDLGHLLPRLEQGELDPGLYVGAVFADSDRTRPVAIVQALLSPASP